MGPGWGARPSLQFSEVCRASGGTRSYLSLAALFLGQGFHRALVAPLEVEYGAGSHPRPTVRLLASRSGIRRALVAPLEGEYGTGPILAPTANPEISFGHQKGRLSLLCVGGCRGAATRMGVMAYLSLYRKYRPQNFDEILGQSHISATLTNAISEDRVAHAYLFTGPRGTGKTSTARILAKAINCEKGPTPTPCGVCTSCVSIEDGSSLDVIEMDAASHSKVDDTREILSGVSLATAGGRRKVYVIDEVHMLSTPAFNALLKTLEEPPPHVIFILATTEAHKVLQTIVSRTQRFDFRPLPADILEGHLTQVAKSEGIEIDQPALGFLARHAGGSARDALSALDQLSSFGGPIGLLEAERMLGGNREDIFLQLFDAIAAEDVASIFVTIHSVIAQGSDPRQLAKNALTHARSLLLLVTAPEAEDLLDVSVEDQPKLVLQAERFSAADLLRTIELISDSLAEMRNTPDHRLLLEVALVRAAAPETDPGATGLLGRIERLERRMGIEGETVPPAPQRTAASLKAAPTPRTVAPAISQPPRSKGADSAPAVARASVAAPTHRESSAATPPSVIAASDSSNSESGAVGLGHVRGAWDATMVEVNRRSKRVGAFLNPSRPLELEEDRLVVEVQSKFHAKEMAAEKNRELFADALHAALGVRPQVAFSARGEATTDEPQGEQVVSARGRASQAGSHSEPERADTSEGSGDFVGEPLADVVEDPVELVKKGLAAQVVEEKNS
ncbi:MAG: polymerase subunit gamma/tau [Actinomycetota bacterium]|nr:polymerase subunit gamma/tau [Actinomycetota bacterium]